MSAPPALRALVEAGDYGAKSGHGFTGLNGATAAAMIAWRDRAYVAISHALAAVGPPPSGSAVQTVTASACRQS